MAFLDNSGDIILDAVLTDTGRMRLAKGDGSFRIVKFALGDDEIDYSLYNGANPSGSAYYDLEILQTPVLEAFSNNIASLNSKLISISRNNLLYLPVIVPNTNVEAFSTATSLVNNGFILAADTTTETFLANNTYEGGSTSTSGLIRGISFDGDYIRVDQGINNNGAGAPNNELDTDLKETSYLVEIDNRFISLNSINSAGAVSATPATPSYIDDDNVAAYYFARGVDTDYVSDLPTSTNAIDAGTQIIAGPKGTSLQFKLRSQNEIVQSNYLFTQIGTLLDGTWGSGGSPTVYGILTNIVITGVTTGATVSIPLLIVKKTS